MRARVVICWVFLMVALTWPLNAGELTTLSASLRQRILNADRLLMLAEGDLRTVRQQFETQRQLNDESESDWNAREQDWQLKEKQLASEISRLRVEKAALERQETNSARDSRLLSDLRLQLNEERTEADRSTRRAWLKGAGIGAGAGLLIAGVLQLLF